MWSSRARVALATVDAFTAVTTVGGGIALATGVESDRFPDAWLEGTPFTSYRVPGLILAGVVGGSATVAAGATLHNPRAGGLTSTLASVVMIGWIVGEIRLLKQPRSRGQLWEVFYFGVGLIMTALGRTVWRAEGRGAAAGHGVQGCLRMSRRFLRPE